MIRVLDDLTIDKIAAGEVIERPVSVVKELVENAIDACASNISVEIKGGGIEYIRVTDNGGGIPYNEVPTAFLRHATSKIVSSEDLFFLSTLGFRGEALASIAAVSHVEMITKTADDLMGTKITYNGGELGECIKSGSPEGTTIIVRDLFYNVPARKKFLNSAQSEGNKIIELMEELVLSNPEISFQLIVNGNVKVQTNGSGNVKDIIFRLYGKETFDAVLPIDYEDDFIKMYGFIAKPEICRPSRSGENYFINGRYVKNEYITRGIEEGYRNFLMQHKYPFVVLFINLDSFGLDVNVHPAKAEIRITNGDFLVDILNKSIKNTLSDNDLVPKAIIFEEEKKPLERAPEPFEKELIKNSYVIQKGYDKKNPDSDSVNKDDDTAPNDKSKEFVIAFDNIFKKDESAKNNIFMNQIAGNNVKSRYEILEEKLKNKDSDEDDSDNNDISSKDASLHENKKEETSKEIKIDEINDSNKDISPKEKSSAFEEQVVKKDDIVFDDDSLNAIFRNKANKLAQEVEAAQKDAEKKSAESDITEDIEAVNESEKKAVEDEKAEEIEVVKEVEKESVEFKKTEEIETVKESDSKKIDDEFADEGTDLTELLKIADEDKSVDKKEEAVSNDRTAFSPKPETKVEFRVKKDGFKTHEEFKSVSKNINPDIFRKVDKFGSATVKKEVKQEEQTLLFQDKTFDKKKIDKYQILGQIFDTYWLITADNELMIMDQHAAHEKVLYEKFMTKFKDNKVETQTLVVAQVASLGKSEMEVFEKYKDEFTKFGFIINDFGDKDLFIRGVPTDLFGSDAKSLFMDIMSELMNVSPSMHVDTIEDRIATRACKAAIKGNQKVTKEECQKLLDYLFTLENPYHCPHGRPTMVKITKTDLEKMFKRIL